MSLKSRALLLPRSIASFVVGYVLLAAANMAFVMFWFVRPLADWSRVPILALAIPYTAVTAGIVGYVVGRIAGRSEMVHAVAVALVMGAVIAVSLVIDVAAEPAWYKWAYLATMIPGMLFGGNKARPLCKKGL
jgi:hypothetical protein